MEKKCRVPFKDNLCTILEKYTINQLIPKVEMAKNMFFPFIMRSELTNYVNAFIAKILYNMFMAYQECKFTF